MTLKVSNIIGGVNDENIIVEIVHSDDWTVELAMIARNDSA